MNFSEINKHNVLIAGFGREGQSVLRFLEKNNFSKQIFIYDKKTFSKFSNEIQINLKNKNIIFCDDSNYTTYLSQIGIAIKSPGIPLHSEIIENIKIQNIKLTTPTNIFFSHVKGITVGITGSKGKSTTASFIYEVLYNSGMNTILCGNIGKPALDFLDNDKNKYFIFEISSQQLENFTGECDYAIFTSFFPDHMDYHGNIKEYFKAKTNILGTNTKIIFNSDIKRLHDYFSQNKRKYLFPFNNDENKINNYSLFIDNHEIFNFEKSHLTGLHNFKNILGATKFLKLLNIKNEIIQKTIDEFKPLAHRLEKIGIFNDITFINDSASVTPDSTIAALQSIIEEIDTIILGGLDRGYNFDQLIKTVVEKKIRNIIIFPDTDISIKNSMKKLNFSPNVYQTNNMKKCVEIALEKTEKNKICLLSPGSPSYNLFKNFYERGELFKTEILNQIKKNNIY